MALYSYAQIPSSCNRSAAFNSSFDEDVRELAILDMLASGTADTSSVGVLPSYSEPIFRALAAVANTSNTLSQADSIFNLYCIHNDREINNIANYDLLVSLDPNVPWTADWLNLITPSGNTAIDSLLSGQPYSIRKPFSFSPNLVLLTFDSIVNIKPIIQLLTGMSGVNYAEGNPLVGDRNYITHTKVGNSSYLSFRLGWDDCPSSCIKERMWTFSVDQTTCSVSYIAVSGNNVTDYNNSPPFQPNCNILLSNKTIPSTAQTIQVYPNPTTNILHIEGASQHIQLYNAMGSLVLQQAVNTTNTTLNLEFLPKGIYLLVVDNQSTQKVVKQ
jgi:hypothetical protein